jgi:hypothetical protein
MYIKYFNFNSIRTCTQFINISGFQAFRLTCLQYLYVVKVTIKNPFYSMAPCVCTDSLIEYIYIEWVSVYSWHCLKLRYSILSIKERNVSVRKNFKH